jgi:hypothetical protein
MTSRLSDAARLLGAKGGSSTSPAKVAAVRLNGLKGGGKPTRYCEMCDDWTRKRECPKCGADTVKGNPE